MLKFPKNKKSFVALYWILSFTWALPTTLLGFLIAIPLLITGHKPKKFCTMFAFPLAEDWGLELGIFAIVDKEWSHDLLCHEYGHQLQACFVWGPLQLFVITIPSIIRYWYRELFPKRVHTDYDDIWFEHDATFRGTMAFNCVHTQEEWEYFFGKESSCWRVK